MTYQVDIAEAQHRLLDLIQAAEQGEEVIITRDQQPLIRLVPLHQLMNRPQFGSARGLITMTDDFDAPTR
jgi:prevent-host-death family protein